jgi:hypothetical protein
VLEGTDGGETVDFSAFVTRLDGDDGYGVRWLITAGGKVSKPYASDEYKRNQELPAGDPAKLPPIEMMKLGPLPPIVSPATQPSE